MAENLKDALQIARKMELDGKTFYSEASEKAGDELAKRFFASLAKDEERHLSIIEKVGQGMGVDIENLPTPAERIQTVFSELEGSRVSEIAATAEEKDAIAVALEMEKKSYELYAEAAEMTSDAQQARLFHRLQAEENQHYEMLINTEEYLNDNDKWFLNSECGLLTGDMSSLG